MKSLEQLHKLFKTNVGLSQIHWQVIWIWMIYEYEWCMNISNTDTLCPVKKGHLILQQWRYFWRFWYWDNQDNAESWLLTKFSSLPAILESNFTLITQFFYLRRKLRCCLFMAHFRQYKVNWARCYWINVWKFGSHRFWEDIHPSPCSCLFVS